MNLTTHTQLFIFTLFDCLFYLNTGQVAHLQISPRRFTKASIALCSALKQTHCALVVFTTLNE